jgi:hypothetical protein
MAKVNPGPKKQAKLSQNMFLVFFTNLFKIVNNFNETY